MQFQSDINSDGLRRNEDLILRQAHTAWPKLASRHAVRHLKDGFMHRLMMSQDARLEMERLLEAQGQKPLEPAESVRLSVFLNGFYLNLVGALDNLAWALTFELELLDDANEDDGRSRRFCGLFKQDFLSALGAKRPILAEWLSAQKVWHDDLKALRDPAAHRVPIGFLTGCVSTDDTPEFQRLMSEAEQSFKAAQDEDSSYGLGWQERMERTRSLIWEGFALRHRAGLLGRFAPIIVLFNGDGHEVRWGPSLIASDQIRFVELSSRIVGSLSGEDS